MPTALHPQAKFDPIPPDLDLHSIVDSTPNFDWVVRISTAQIRRLGPSGFEKLVQLHVIEGGRPLVIEGWNKVLPESLFSAKWLETTYDKKQENVRDIGAASDIPMTTGHYLRSMRQLTNQWSPSNFRDERRQRLYLKDIDCPPEWAEHLRKVIPPNVFYMNENVSENSSIDTRDDDIFGAPEPTAAIAGDLMSSLAEDMRAQNLMCYVGHEGTYTPAHREMCASLGQNIMVEASGDENGEKPGSSIWFMTETKDREVVREYFLSMLGHDIEIEKHFAQINAWKKANFPVYVVEQKAGDFILVPPLAPHQVWNRGTRTMKVAWNRTTVDTLDLAVHEALPKARLVCRDEQYKNKAIIYYTLEKYYKELQAAEESVEVGILGLGRELSSSPRLKQMANDFRKLFELFTQILIDEMFGYKHIDTEFIDFDSNITCSYCRSNIFNRFLTCKCCVRPLINDDEDTYDICMECYAMGRSCVCISGLQWCEQWQWSDLVQQHETWRAMVIKQDGFVDVELSPQPLEIARKKSGKKAVAQICQEQLRRRPWNDITKPAVEAPAEESEPEPEVDDEGRVKKKSKPKRKVKKGDTYRCHVCCHKDYTYKLNYCTTCQEAYCYGVLWRAFDTMPQAAMEQEHWQCPKCLGICNCGSCRRTGHTIPYVPKSTLLGHDTRRVADDRSVETIVDFRVHNLGWLKAAGEENRSKNSKRMQRLVEKAVAEKAKDPLASLEASTEDAPHEIDSAAQDTVMQHRTEGQSLDDGVAPDAAFNAHALNEELPGSRVQMADMSRFQNHDGDSVYPDPSPYPDPSIGARMMGMGFYDQDDSADRILFDAFQLPAADAMNNEPEVSEFVKKTLRMAKRKARLDTDDDPDFPGPKRSHHRKKPKTGNIDQLVNLDPALLGSLGNPGGSSTGTPIRTDVQPRSGEHPAFPEGNDQQPESVAENPRPKPTRPPLPIEPLRPILRHAKPAQSYVEAEEPGEDPEDIVPVNPLRLFSTDDEESNIVEDPIDLATEAIKALTGQDAETEASTAPEAFAAPAGTPQQAGKRRGRPPGRPSRASLPTSAPATVAKVPKKRGRPPRRSQGNADDTEDVAMADADAVQHGGTSPVDDLEAELERALGGEDDEDDSNAEPATSTAAAPRRRGRPAGRRSLPASASEHSPIRAPDKVSYMSMAERMAARGKKIKIREKSRGGETPKDGEKAKDPLKFSPAIRSSVVRSTPAGANQSSITENKALDYEPTGPILKRSREELDDEFVEPQVSSSASNTSHKEEATRSAPTRRPRGSTGVKLDTSESGGPSANRPRGPTVVRLDLSDSDGSSASESDDDDDGIPARYIAVRGGRGRGRGRGGRSTTRGLA
ncbi:hypothetical protein BJ170DRAFT_605965 [Xylariales sp. AK1849]|nr:hypothetical protein BJ170DRAFT_605965 [Xylariales sp. AK1849]